MGGATMSVETRHDWITPEEASRERRRLRAAGVRRDAPEYQALLERIGARDNYLYETYARKYRATDEGKWVAISLDGEVLIHPTASEAIWAGAETFGEG